MYRMIITFGMLTALMLIFKVIFKVFFFLIKVTL